MNSITLKDITAELQLKTDLYEVMAGLQDQITRDRREFQQARSLGRSTGTGEVLELRRKIEELQDRCREYELTRTKHLTTKKDQANKELIKDLEDADAHIQELRV